MANRTARHWLPFSLQGSHSKKSNSRQANSGIDYCCFDCERIGWGMDLPLGNPGSMPHSRNCPETCCSICIQKAL